MATPRASTPSPPAETPCYICGDDFGVNADGECNFCGYMAHKKKRRARTPGTASRARKRPKTICKENDEKSASCTTGPIPLCTTPEPRCERLAVQDEIGIFLQEQGVGVFQEGHSASENYLTANALLGGDLQSGHDMSADKLFLPIQSEDEMLSLIDNDIGQDIDTFFSTNHFDTFFPPNYFEDKP